MLRLETAWAAGDVDKAITEWQIALTLDSGNCEVKGKLIEALKKVDMLKAELKIARETRSNDAQKKVEELSEVQ